MVDVGESWDATCHICRRSRPNEQFGGRGQRANVCSKCRRRPKSEPQRIPETEVVHGFLLQSRISTKNIKRLEQLASIEDADFQLLRTLVVKIANVRPSKGGRWRAIQLKHSALYKQIVDSELFDYLLDEYDCEQMYDDEEP